ncbi:hypothetical protein MIND_01208700 [Mycena indigotica]|uniref:Uncharacterized protein n=1 Tax=Mycena indigotica TaxID=2126181 RepID=A0A8H6S691_9AGAR|nr:uncharacterized protein MIND_01208700 [Mycena indigotica]KAF7293093.1 hypothetical protein MIND_01208700 [Mycena indigotica]
MARIPSCTDKFLRWPSIPHQTASRTALHFVDLPAAAPDGFTPLAFDLANVLLLTHAMTKPLVVRWLSNESPIVSWRVSPPAETICGPQATVLATFLCTSRCCSQYGFVMARNLLRLKLRLPHEHSSSFMTAICSLLIRPLRLRARRPLPRHPHTVNISRPVFAAGAQHQLKQDKYHPEKRYRHLKLLKSTAAIAEDSGTTCFASTAVSTLRSPLLFSFPFSAAKCLPNTTSSVRRLSRANKHLRPVSNVTIPSLLRHCCFPISGTLLRPTFASCIFCVPDV